MNNGDAEEISNEEYFENSYRVFILALGALASTAEEACRQYGNYNVAWEIRDDVAAGLYLGQNPAHRLSAQHVAEIQKLADILDSLPASVVKFTNIIEESLENMHHPAWELARRMAAQLLESLHPVTETNESYFHRQANEP